MWLAGASAVSCPPGRIPHRAVVKDMQLPCVPLRPAWYAARRCTASSRPTYRRYACCCATCLMTAAAGGRSATPTRRCRMGNGSRQCTCKAHRWRANIAAREATGGGCRAVGAHRWDWARPTPGDSVCAWCVACPDSTHLNRGVRPHSAPRAEGSMSTTHGKREACDAYRSEF